MHYDVARALWDGIFRRIDLAWVLHSKKHGELVDHLLALVFIFC